MSLNEKVGVLISYSSRKNFFLLIVTLSSLIYLSTLWPVNFSSNIHFRKSGKCEDEFITWAVRASEQIQVTSFVINTSTCRIPDLDPWHESTRAISSKCDLEDEREPKCGEKVTRSWLYSNGSNLIVNLTAIHEDGYSWSTVRCCYRIIERVEQSLESYDTSADSVVRLTRRCYRLKRKVNRIPYEFIKAFCISTSIPLFEDAVYRNYFAFPRANPHAQDKILRWESIPVLERPPNVLILGIDTNSRLNSRRQLHKTLEIFRTIGAVELFGYTKVGENTFPNTIPFFTGLSEKEMKPICYKSESDSQDDCPYIWKDFDRAGYLTATVDDCPAAGIFNYRKTGFVLPPTDFYYRPFTLALLHEPRESDWKVKCVGTQRNDQVQLNYLSDILQRASQGAPVFLHSWSTTYTHGCINNAAFLDAPLAKFLLDNVVNSSNTILFFMSDHGDRYGDFRETTLGWYEDKLPTMWVYMTPDLKKKFPDWDKSIRINARRLTSHFDLYHTLIQILDVYNDKFYSLTFNESYGNKTVPRRTGKTLWKPLPENRTCDDAGIPRGYCACAVPELLDAKIEKETLKGSHWEKIVSAVLLYLEKILPKECARPTLKRIISGKYLKNAPGNWSGLSENYVLSFYTDPGDFLFEATVKADEKREYSVDSLSDILRMNKITRAVRCVSNPEIERYCYCL